MSECPCCGKEFVNCVDECVLRGMGELQSFTRTFDTCRVGDGNDAMIVVH